MPVRSIEASSARPSQTQLEGCADDTSSLKSNTVAQTCRAGAVQANLTRIEIPKKAPCAIEIARDLFRLSVLERVRSSSACSIG